MPIASSGAISFSDLRTEFVGGSSAISFADLYRGGSNVRAKANDNTGVNLAASVPTSGEISIANFQGQAKGFRFTFTSGATNQSAATIFGDDYDLNYPKEIIINAGVELGATSTSEEALEIPAGGAGAITVTNNGTLTGAGGAAGQAGGDAFETAVAVTLINNGVIRAGGGGGGTGGQGSYTSSSTSGPTYSAYYPKYIFRVFMGYQGSGWWNNAYFGTGGSTGFTGNDGAYYTRGSYRDYVDPQHHYEVSRTVYTTNYTSGGTGGVGQGYNQSATSGSGGGTNAGSGGAGASYGQAGGSGVNGNYTNGAGGGASGASVRGYSNVTLTQNGSFLGAVA